MNLESRRDIMVVSFEYYIPVSANVIAHSYHGYERTVYKTKKEFSLALKSSNSDVVPL